MKVNNQHMEKPEKKSFPYFVAFIERKVMRIYPIRNSNMEQMKEIQERH